MSTRKSIQNLAWLRLNKSTEKYCAWNLFLTRTWNFDGDAAEAMKYYHSVLGGELSLQTFAEAKMPGDPKEMDRIVHASLKSEGLTLMASDTRLDSPPKFGDNIHLSLGGQDEDRLTKAFNGLAKEGKVDMPLAKQFWGDTFGMLTEVRGSLDGQHYSSTPKVAQSYLDSKRLDN